jgi:rhodanese-related sulfurtransferase
VLALAAAAEDCSTSGAALQVAASPESADSTLEVDESACEVDADALGQAPWSAALLVDLRRSSELDGVHIPNAIRLRRPELDSLHASADDLPVLLLGSGLDDAALRPLCVRLAARRTAPVALLRGGVPAWAGAGRSLLLPSTTASDGMPTLLEGGPAREALANPQARVLDLGPQFALPADIAAQMHRSDPDPATPAQLAEAAADWLSALPADRSGPALVLAPADADLVAALTRLSASQTQPFWLYIHDPAGVAGRDPQAFRRPDVDPLRPESCAWN